MFKTIITISFALLFSGTIIGNLLLSIHSQESYGLPCKPTGEKHMFDGIEMNILECIEENKIVNKSTPFRSNKIGLDDVQMYYKKCEHYDDRPEEIVYIVPEKCSNAHWYNFNLYIFILSFAIYVIVCLVYGIVYCFEERKKEKERQQTLKSVSFSNPLYDLGQTQDLEPVYDEAIFASKETYNTQPEYLNILPADEESNVVLTDTSSNNSIIEGYEQC